MGDCVNYRSGGEHLNQFDLEVRVIEESSLDEDVMLTHPADLQCHHSVSWGAEDFRFQIYIDIQYLIGSYKQAL
jgi:hypothetical protein